MCYPSTSEMRHCESNPPWFSRLGHQVQVQHVYVPIVGARCQRAGYAARSIAAQSTRFWTNRHFDTCMCWKKHASATATKEHLDNGCVFGRKPVEGGGGRSRASTMSVQPAVQVREAALADGKVVAMGSGGTNYQFRKVLNRQNADAVKVIYDIPRSKYIPGCCQNLCSCCKCCGDGICPCECDAFEEVNKAADESTYTWVMENRMEFSRPIVGLKDELCAACCCKFRVFDNIFTAHFDQGMFDYVGVQKGPKGCVLKCCGSPGDKISFRQTVCGCPSAKYCGVEMQTLLVSAGQGEDTVQIIKTARDNARARMK